MYYGTPAVQTGSYSRPMPSLVGYNYRDEVASIHYLVLGDNTRLFATCHLYQCRSRFHTTNICHLFVLCCLTISTEVQQRQGTHQFRRKGEKPTAMFPVCFNDVWKTCELLGRQSGCVCTLISSSCGTKYVLTLHTPRRPKLLETNFYLRRTSCKLGPTVINV